MLTSHRGRARAARALVLGNVLLGLVLAAAPAQATPEREKREQGAPATRLEMAREESAVRSRPATAFTLPAGSLRLSGAEAIAASHATVAFTVTLDRAVADGRLVLTLPSRWTGRSGVSGLAYADVPTGGAGTSGRADARRSGRSVSLSFSDAQAGDSAHFDLVDNGLPAGRYAVPYRWIEDGTTTATGSAAVVFYAPAREAGAAGPDWGRFPSPSSELNATNDAVTESETFLSVVPGDPTRFLVGANTPTGYNAWLTNTGGAPFTKLAVPTTIDAPGAVGPETGDLCCDPMSAADALGNLWYGGLSFSNGIGNPSRIIVNRIAPGASAFQAQTVGLPVRTAGTQDKPMMTIDGSSSSPTFGRLYVVWDEPDNSGAVNVVISQCDTRPAGIANAANCDNADNWTTPVTISSGSHIYADVAVGPGGEVYVVWWDYSATNAIRGDVCLPASQDCATAAAWSGGAADHTIATLDETGGEPLPFACPIMAQPGGRASTASNVEVDHSGGPENGRVYVTWSDLRTGSGSTRCAVDNFGDGTPPLPTHLTFDSFVASAPGALPGSAAPSPDVATRLLTDGEGGGQSNSDDWFPWLAVDQSTGQAYADFYSTRDDALRQTTNFYARSVTPTGATHSLGPLVKVSSAASDYSASTCCTFGNDYGDYTGIDATSGVAFPVWSDKRGGTDGEAFLVVPVSGADTTAPDTTIDSGPADGSTVTTASVQFAFSAGEAGSTFECRVDGAFSACTSPFSSAALANGSHVFAARATDPSGNVDPSPARRTFTVAVPPAPTPTPTPTPSPTATPTPVPTATPAATLAAAVFGSGTPGRVRVTRTGFATLPRPRVNCPVGPLPCQIKGTGRARLPRSAKTRKLSSTATRVATGSSSVPAAGSAVVRLKLTKKALAALKRLGTMKTTVTITAVRGTTVRTRTVTVTLLRPRTATARR